jgi:opine dehydrogenase
MHVTVIGGGNGSHAAVVDQVLRGHDVSWYRRPGRPLSAEVRYSGVLGNGTVHASVVTDDLVTALDGTDLVLVPVPATATADLLDQMAPLLPTGVAVAFMPGTFATLDGARRRPDVAFLETGTLPYLTRVVDGIVHVPVVSAHLPTGSLPGNGELADRAHTTFAHAYPAAARLEDGLDAALANWGPIIHPPLIVHNLGAIENLAQDFDIHAEGTSPTVRRTQTALDVERLSLRRRLGYHGYGWPLADYYAGSDSSMYPPDAKARLQASNLWRESVTMDHRYVTEDITLGLVLLESLARAVGHPTPVISSVLELMGAALGRDLRGEGRTLASLGVSSVDELLQRVGRPTAAPSAASR